MKFEIDTTASRGEDMSRDKQILEMAEAIEQARIKATDTTNSMNYGFGGWYAKELYNAGYRKASEVVEDIIRILRAAGMNEYRYPVIAEIKKKYTEEMK
jgi:hypothetical protein